jgi:hypothetical protein
MKLKRVQKQKLPAMFQGICVSETYGAKPSLLVSSQASPIQQCSFEILQRPNTLVVFRRRGFVEGDGTPLVERMEKEYNPP